VQVEGGVTRDFATWLDRKLSPIGKTPRPFVSFAGAEHLKEISRIFVPATDPGI